MLSRKLLNDLSKQPFFKFLRIKKKLLNFPYAYLLYKSKNLNAIRPIVAYSCFELSKISSIVNKALSLILKSLKMKHFVIFQTESLKAKVLEFEPDKGKVYTFDLKNAFTCLQKKHVKHCVQEIISIFYQESQISTIFVPQKKREKAKFWIKDVESPSFWKISLKKLKKMSFWELNNTFFKVGNRIFEQKEGIPMGAPSSPAYLLAVSIIAHQHFLSRLPQNSPTPSLVQFMDDGLLQILGDSHQQKIALESLSQSFGSGLELVLEEIESTHKFLGCAIEKGPHNFRSRIFNKNVESIERTGRQKFPRFTHFDSATSTKIQKGVIISALYRIENHTTTLFGKIFAVMEIFAELTILKYPKKMLLDTLHAMSQSQTNDDWLTIRNFVVSIVNR